ncbi:coiled-coil domain-containing protein 12 [Hordeum vulgare]|nr:coiled-coil domain-containing protein 12 [Hordeum vulgare]
MAFSMINNVEETIQPGRNGEHGTAEEQGTGPALPGPVAAPENASKENVSPTKESDEVQDNGLVMYKDKHDKSISF